MASKINICNMALSLIGANDATDLDNPTMEEERQCNLWWDQAVNEIMEEHDWKFARGYEAALAVSTSPSAEYDHAYELPTDCLVLRCLWDTDALKRITDSEYELHGSAILTDLDTVNIIYTRNDVSVGSYPTHFIKALIFLLAHYFSYKLAEKGGKTDNLLEKYQSALIKAIDRDQAQGNYPEAEEDPWLAAGGFGSGSTETRIVQTNTGYIEV